jgi:hypothetical protein
MCQLDKTALHQNKKLAGLALYTGKTIVAYRNASETTINIKLSSKNYWNI